MSQENVEIALAWVDRWNAGERPGFTDQQVHPDAVLVSRGIMASHPLRGPEGFREWLREIDEQFDEWTLSVEELRDAGDCVAALCHVHYHGRQQDIASDFLVGILVEIRDGRMVRMETFIDDPAEALEAAGLSE
jgi:ketosteroid isomerase-like protein